MSISGHKNYTTKQKGPATPIVGALPWDFVGFNPDLPELELGLEARLEACRLMSISRRR